MSAKQVIVAGEYGTGNAGDESRLTLLRSVLDKHQVQLKVIGRPIGTIGADTNVFFPNLYHLDPPGQAKLFRGYNYGDDAEHLQTIAREISKSACLIIGGGNLVLDISIGVGRGLLTQYVHLALLAKFLGTKILLYGISAGPLKTDLGRSSATLLFNLADKISVIDEESVDLVRSLTGREADLLVEPAVAALAPSQVVRGRSRKRQSEVTGDSLLVSAKAWGPLDGELTRSYIRNIAELVNSTSSRWKRVGFVAHESSSEVDDHQVHREIARQLETNDVIFEEHTSDPHEVFRTYGRYSTVLTSRFHGAMFSILHGLSTVVVSDLPKTARLLKALRLEPYHFSLQEFADGSESIQNLLFHNSADFEVARDKLIDEGLRDRDEYTNLLKWALREF